MKTFLSLFLLFATPLAFAQSGKIVDNTAGANIGKSIEGLLVDYAQASVAAGALANLGDGPTTVVENVRDFSVLVRGIDTSLPSIGVSWTPARTSFPFPRINLASYAANIGTRLLGSTTISYAQSRTDDAGTSQKFDRRAIAIETSAYIRPEDDPVVAVATDCTDLTSVGVNEAPPNATPPGRAEEHSVPDKLKPVLAEFDACSKKTLADLATKWNRSRFSLSAGTGWIKPSDGSTSQESLGRTAALGVVYGFDHVAALRDNAALTLVVRRSQKEPVLASMLTGPLVLKNSTLLAGRLSGGSSVFRGLVEVSNAKSSDITTTQATFVRAIGVDYRVLDGLWLGLRAGYQRKLDGSGTEVGSFATVSYSPSPSLGH